MNEKRGTSLTYGSSITPIALGVILFLALAGSGQAASQQVCIRVLSLCTESPCPTISPEPCEAPSPSPSLSPTPTPPSGGGGGSGGGGTPAQSQVVLSGKAFPRSTVTLLKDAQVVASTIADSNANFRIALSGVTGGSYIFSLYSEDIYHNRSSLFSFPVVVTQGVLVDISNIFLAPLISTDKIEVRKGEKIGVLGKTVPESEVTIIVGSDEELFGKVKADTGGAYLHYFDTLNLSLGQHSARSQAYKENEASPFSKSAGFVVGTKTVLAKPENGCGTRGDVNNDCRVNLVDFSIVAYWYRRPGPSVKVDINGDSKVDLIDFSIMAYYWTG
ncbi:MAG: hypothetical protein UX65_C0002G0034 [Parcubacteria group bacterium GW2011_GWB1_46_8]|nr:MAG: hypothetical protein UX14_C0004G0025 [Parcubacteria group bacterium GW2011_GWF1_45_5]KKU11557.1 MAG: hypothetical protein UX15_C0002G0010 [Parcubacteria group bacterium GW2011_GWA1_45_7]KKU44366.1 MAG: hypothetical protein UX61_C0002G0009 [Parcubacteria group bacterium GW2011_GWA2_46_7]KKU46560.1 MAG: hypothetical protein UX65_C0002G0034 [Parcubacteria group bacterium GW2011_GWB1_46_8]KKU48005.1 MAG: hypothetical protein UX66_C0001G0024 [Parcubacteria group bacterium GW2011_GWF2_46_8]